MKKFFLLVAFALLAWNRFSAQQAQYQTNPPMTKTDAPPKADATPLTKRIEKDPPTDWMSQYDDFDAMERTIQKLKKDNGIDVLEQKAQVLGNQLLAEMRKEGWDFDRQTRKWFKLEVPKQEEKK